MNGSLLIMVCSPLWLHHMMSADESGAGSAWGAVGDHSPWLVPAAAVQIFQPPQNHSGNQPKLWVREGHLPRCHGYSRLCRADGCCRTSTSDLQATFWVGASAVSHRPACCPHFQKAPLRREALLRVLTPLHPAVSLPVRPGPIGTPESVRRRLALARQARCLVGVTCEGAVGPIGPPSLLLRRR